MKQYFIHDTPQDRKAVTEWCDNLFGPRAIPGDFRRWNWFPLFQRKGHLVFRVDIQESDDQIVFELTWKDFIVVTE